MDRQRTSTALAKAIAYVNCGKPEKAVEWVAALLSDFAAEGVDVEYAFHFSAAMVPILDEPVEEIRPDLSASARHAERIERQDAEDIRERQRDMRAASAWLGGRLLGREGSVQL